MSNSDDSLYLRGRTGRNKDVVAREELDDVSDCKIVNNPYCSLYVAMYIMCKIGLEVYSYMY